MLDAQGDLPSTPCAIQFILKIWSIREGLALGIHLMPLVIQHRLFCIGRMSAFSGFIALSGHDFGLHCCGNFGAETLYLDRALSENTRLIAGIGNRYVGGCRETGDGREPHVKKHFGHLHSQPHVTKTGRKNKLVAGCHQITNDAFCVWTFGHVLDIAGLDPGPQGCLNRSTPLVMLTNPAHIMKWRYSEKARLEWLIDRQSRSGSL